MNALLRIAEWCCGPALRESVFEPLVADWQRQWRDAPASGWACARILAGGSIALLWSIAQCVLTGGIRMPRIALIKASAVLVISTALLMLIQMGLNLQQFSRRVDFPFEMRIWMALPPVLPLAVPLSMLPIMMLMRGAGRVNARAATMVVLAGGLLTLVTTGILTPLSRGDVRDSLYEEIDRRNITAAEQARPETPEQRAKRREAYRNDPRYIEYQANLTRPRWNRSTFMTAALGITLGVLGWALGGLGRTRAIHAAGWWAFIWLALMVLDGRARYWVNGGVVQLGQAPYWAPLAVFATAALTLSIASRRTRHTSTSP